MNLVSRMLLSAIIAVAMPALAQQDSPIGSLGKGQSGKVWFLSVDKTSSPFAMVQGRANLSDPIYGVLEFPANTAGKVPAIVVAHSSAGVKPHDYDWAARLRAIGLATFIVDSFGPRGIGSTGLDQSKINTTINAADALLALKLLSTHPDIDRERIAVIGWSRGGTAAIRTKLDPLRRALTGNDNRFAAHVGLYPFCESTVWSNSVTSATALVMSGGLDQYTTASSCRALVERMNGRGANIQFVEIAGAYHGFDLETPAQWSTVENYSKCLIEQDVDKFAFMRIDTGATLSMPDIKAYLGACRKQSGENIGATAGTREKSMGQV